VAFDYLKRGNKKKTTNPEEMKKYTINQQSWDLISTILLDNKEYEFLALVARATEKDKNIKISDDIRKKKIKEAGEKADFQGLHNYLIQKGPKSKNIIEQEEVRFKKQKTLIDSFEKIQPSFDRVPSIPERDI